MITKFFEIPLQPIPMDFMVRDSVENTYRFLTQYREVDEGGWILDIDNDNTGERLVHGIPLVSGLDLLWQYNHLNIRFHLLMDCRDGRTTPTFESLGVEDKLIAVYYDVDPERPSPLQIMLTKVPIYAADIIPSFIIAPDHDSTGEPIGLLLSLTKAS